MKHFTKLYIGFTLLLCLRAMQLNAQSVSISEEESTADASAILDVQSTTQGMLVPRMTEAQRLLVPTPATGLMVYQLHDAAGFYFYDGINWTGLFAGAEQDPSYTASPASSITDAGSGVVISDTERSTLGSAIQTEEDPIYSSSPANQLTSAEVADLKAIVASKANVPVGTIMPYAGVTSEIPNGWLLCDGSAYLKSDYQTLADRLKNNWDSVNTNIDQTLRFHVPDLRGQFLRGTDSAGIVDEGVADRLGNNEGSRVGSRQGDAIRNIYGQMVDVSHGYVVGLSTNGVFSQTHLSKGNATGGGSSWTVTFDASRVVPTTDYENRPKNVYVNYIIKF